MDYIALRTSGHVVLYIQHISDTMHTQRNELPDTTTQYIGFKTNISTVYISLKVNRFTSYNTK